MIYHSVNNTQVVTQKIKIWKPMLISKENYNKMKINTYLMIHVVRNIVYNIRIRIRRKLY